MEKTDDSRGTLAGAAARTGDGARAEPRIPAASSGAGLPLAPPDKRGSVGARRSEASEAAILEATAALLAEVGYGALTMEAVAKRARAGKATLYRWWPTKGHLALALISRAKLEMTTPATGDLRSDLVAYMTEVVALWRGEAGLAIGPLVRHIYAEAWSSPDLAAALQEERRARWIRLDEILQAAVRSGQLPQVTDLARAKDFLMSWPFYGLMTDKLPAPEEVPAMVEDSLRGLIGRATPG